MGGIRAGSVSNPGPMAMDETELAKTLVWAATNHFPAELVRHGAEALRRLPPLDPLRNFMDSAVEVFSLDAEEVAAQATRMAIERAEYARRNGRAARACPCAWCLEEKQQRQPTEGV